MPDIIDLKSPIYHACGSVIYRILPETETNQIMVSGEKLTLTELLKNIDRAVGGNYSMRFAKDIAERDELAGILPGDRVYVLDASADEDAQEGHGAFYVYLPTLEWRMIGSDARIDIRDFLQAGGGIYADADGKIAVMPGKGLKVGSDGAICNLAPGFNSEEWITVSGDYVVRVTGWHEVWLIGGGHSPCYYYDGSLLTVNGGSSGPNSKIFIHLEKDQVVPVTIGAAGQTLHNEPITSVRSGGATYFGEHSSNDGNNMYYGADAFYQRGLGSGEQHIMLHGPGHGASWNGGEGIFFGGAGSAYLILSGGKITQATLGRSKPGAVRLRYYDPARDQEAKHE